MRNQCWNQQGQLVEDLELTRVASVATAIDHLAGTQRGATPEEEAQIVREEREGKVKEARERAIAAVKANRVTTPWGMILYDLAVAQGLIEPG